MYKIHLCRYDKKKSRRLVKMMTHRTIKHIYYDQTRLNLIILVICILYCVRTICNIGR